MSSPRQSIARVISFNSSMFQLLFSHSTLRFWNKTAVAKKPLSKNTPHFPLKPRTSKSSTFHGFFCMTFLKTKTVGILLIISFFF